MTETLWGVGSYDDGATRVPWEISHAEIVDAHDKGHWRAHGGAEARTVEDIELPGAERQGERVPDRVARDRRRAAAASQRETLDGDEPLELRQQSEQVARRARARLPERRDVDADVHAWSLASVTR